MRSDHNTRLAEFIRSLPPKNIQTLDRGNSHPHCAHFVEGTLTEVRPATEDDTKLVTLATASVTRKNQNSFDDLWQDHLFASMPVHYTRELGSDRLYQATLLYHLYPKEQVVLIDAGTFLTIDFIDAKGFQGGYIYPGLKTFLKSYQTGDQLPHLSLRDYQAQESLKDLPHQTNEAILGAAWHYVSGLLSHHNLSDQRVILTGGEADVFKDNIECTVMPHLIHYALYFLDNLRRQEARQ